MSTTRSKDRAGLCSFTFANGHRCRSLRSTSHPHLCYYHARKESQARAAEQIGRDISYFFSGRYLSACDLTAVLARLFSAVASGELRPKTASTLAYLARTLLQTIHLAQDEYINAFGTDACAAPSVPPSKTIPTTAHHARPSLQALLNNPFRLHSLSRLSQPSVRPCPATGSCPTTRLEQPTRPGIVPPGTVIRRFQRIQESKDLNRTQPPKASPHATLTH